MGAGRETVGTPGLRVALSVKPVEEALVGDEVAIRVDVAHALRPLRVSVYLDGDLVDTWTPGTGGYELRLPAVRGRHVVTARAIDAAGRWGGASALFELGAA
jgi:hypothetical protein